LCTGGRNSFDFTYVAAGTPRLFTGMCCMFSFVSFLFLMNQQVDIVLNFAQDKNCIIFLKTTQKFFSICDINKKKSSVHFK
jgi:hypothetical protein